MDAFDQFRQFAQVLNGPADVIRRFCFILQFGIGVHQVPGIQHDAHIFTSDTLKKVFHVVRICQPQPRPPEILKQDGYVRRNSHGNSIENIGSRFQHFQIRILKIEGIGFLYIRLRNVPDHIFRFYHGGGNQMLLYDRQPFILVQGAEVTVISCFCRLEFPL